MHYLPQSDVQAASIADLRKTIRSVLALREECPLRGVTMARKLRDDGSQINEHEWDSEEEGSDSAGQSGDAQGLSQIADADEESVGELAETDQAYEAEIVDGLENAADHPERPVHTREDKGRS